MTTLKQKHNLNNKTKNKTKNKTRKNKTYTNKDFKSNDGMISNVWGPALWHYLHTMSFNYPVHPTIEEKRHYRNFILSLRHVLPCKYCRINLKTNFKQLPITMADMKNRETFSRYIYNLHELINKMLNKKSNLSYCDVRERYEHFRSRCTDEKPKIFKYSNFTRKKEKGCTEPLYGNKSKCIINIVPQNIKGETIQIDKSCIKHR
jgi:hypothetical protein